MNAFKKIIVTFLFYFLLNTLSFAESNWSSVAKRDLITINSLISTQTPGAVDKQNPSYQEWMKRGLNLSNELANKAGTYKGYFYTLKYYVNGFHDEHFQLKFKKPSEDQVLWPGFLVYYQHGHFYVSSYAWNKLNAKKLPPVDARVVECDGLSPEVLMLRNMFPYEGSSQLEADWVGGAPWLLINQGNPWASYPKRCVFVLNKKNYLVNLDWHLMPQHVNPNKAAYNYQSDFSVAPFGAEGIWVSIPSFNAAKGKSLAGLQALVRMADQWQSKKLIVIDVRGNGGGNSEWGTQILSKLYGESYFLWSQNQHTDRSYDEWRVSKENLNYIKSIDLPYIENSSGENSDVYKNMLSVVRLMESALNKENQFGLVREIYQSTSVTVTKQPLNPVKGKVIVVTDGRCGSSCLTFIEQALNMPHLLLVGAPTHANTYYNEIRFEKLPSGYAEFGFPMKVTRNRSRLANQPYTPQYIFPGNINDTLKLQKWILQSM